MIRTKKKKKLLSARGFMLATRTTMSCSHLCHNLQGVFVNHHFAKQREGMHGSLKVVKLEKKKIYIYIEEEEEEGNRDATG